MENQTAPTVNLTSGQQLKLLEIKLYDRKYIQTALKIKAKAAKALGGNGPAFGLIGPMNLTFAAEVAAFSLISSAIANSAQKTALEELSVAQGWHEKAKREAKYHSTDLIAGINEPDPASWLAMGDPRDTQVTIYELSKAQKKEACLKHGKDYGILMDDFLVVPIATRCIHNGDDFIYAKTADGEVCFRWSEVVSFIPGVDAAIYRAPPEPEFRNGIMKYPLALLQ